MAKQPEHGLMQTKSEFKIVGKVTGVGKDDFFKTTETKKTKKEMLMMNFGLEFDKGKTVYVQLQSMKPENVYFYQKPEVKGEKGIVETVPYENIKNFKDKNQGFNIIGKAVGVEKYPMDHPEEDKRGKNMVKYLCDYDTLRYLKAKLKDDMSLNVIGEIEVSSYVKDNVTKRAVKFIPNKLFATKEEIDFEKEGFEPTALFTQQIIVMGYGETDDGDTTVQAKVVNFSNIEDTELIIRKDNPLSSTMQRNVVPYTSIKVFGNIEVTANVEEVVENDEWGLPNKMDKQGSQVKRELVITGADPSTIETEVYSEENMNEALRKLTATEQANNDWGTDQKTSDEGEDW